MPDAPLPLSRRGFLRAGAVTAAVLAGAGATTAWWAARDEPAGASDERPEVLTPSQLAVLTAFADRVIAAPPDGPSARDARIARRVDRELALTDGRLADDVRGALLLLEYGPLLDGLGGRFTRLAPAQQDAALDAAARSRWAVRRNAFSGLRTVCLFLYYADDRTWPAIGYAGPMVPRKLPEASSALASLPPLGGRA